MLQQQTTLIVSKDPAAKNRARQLLVPGQEIRQVSTLGEAVTILFSEGYLELPCRVVVDEQLPDGDGATLIAHIRNDPWLRRATFVVPLPAPVEELTVEITDEMVIDALDRAGIP